MKKTLFLLSLSAVLLFNINSTYANHNVENISADEALKKLQKGNERFIKNKSSSNGR